MASSEDTLTSGLQAPDITGSGATQRAAAQNVGQTERWVSAIGGGALALYGLTRGSLGGIALALVGAALVQRGVTGHCNVYEAMNFSTAEEGSLRSSENVSVQAERGMKVEKSVTVHRPAALLYDFWRNFANLPRFMHHLESVRMTGEGRSRWVAKGPAGSTVEWEAEVYNDKPCEMIAWRSLEGSQVANAGSVHFEEGPVGTTTVRVSLKYDPPGGKLGSVVAYIFGENPSQQIASDLQRFKEIMESRAASDATEQQRGASAGK